MMAGSDLAEHGLDGLLDTLAAVAVAAVTQFDGLVLAGRCTRRDRGASETSVVEQHLDLHRGVTPGIEDLAGSDLLNDGHWMILLYGGMDRVRCQDTIVRTSAHRGLMRPRHGDRPMLVWRRRVTCATGDYADCPTE